MTITIDHTKFDFVDYDPAGDTLYLRDGPDRATTTWETVEGHHVELDPDGSLVALELANARLLADRDGILPVTVPRRIAITVRGEDIAAALADRAPSRR